jgi:hypothetical protein
LNQERILFEKLIVANHHPQIAVFIDGINEGYYSTDHTAISADLSLAVARKNGKCEGTAMIESLPVNKLFAFGKPDNELAKLQMQHIESQGERPSPEKYLTIIRDRYEANRRLVSSIASEFQVKPLFVWQPAPTYEFDCSRHPFPAHPTHLITAPFYQQMSIWLDLTRTTNSILDLSRIQRNLTEPLYVDYIHYSAFFCDHIAGRIADHIQTLGWLI